MITFKLNLLEYKAVIQKVRNKSGELVEAVVIPIDANMLVKGKNGVYADFVAFEFDNKKTDNKDTHLIKRSFPKEVFQAMSDDEKRSQPIFGNLRVWGDEHEPTSSTEVLDETSDLPF